MAARAFLLGKLPAHGDFVARGLAADARDRWDAWGSAALDALRHRAGPDFEAAHSEAPAWRFVAQGEAGWRAGALAPSVDAVGRRFLLLVGAEGLAPELAGAAGLMLADAAEALVFDAVAGGLDADRALAAAEARLGEILAAAEVVGSRLAAPPGAQGVWWTLGSAACPPQALSAREPPVDLFARTVARAAALETTA